MRNTLKALAFVILAVAIIFSISFARSYNSNSPGWLGVQVQTVDDDLADAFNLEIKYGVIINDVTRRSPAADADLEEGDVINMGNLWDSEVLEVTDDKVVFEHLINDGDTFETQIGYDEIKIDGDEVVATSTAEVGAEVITVSGRFIISDMDDEFIYVDMNSPLAGKTLIFEIEVVEIVE